MKILLYSYFYYPEVGAASIRMQYFVKSLENAGHEVRVLTPKPNYPYGKLYDDFKTKKSDPSDKIFYVPIYLRKNHSLFGRLMSYCSYFFTSIYYSFKINCRPDVIISSTPPIFTPFAARVVSKLRGTKFILDVRDIWPDIGIELGILKNKLFIRGLKFIEKVILNGADYITVTANADKINLVSKNIDPDKIFIVYNGADTSMFKASFNSTREKIKANFNLPIDKQIIVFFGSFNDGMNDIEGLSEALKNFNGAGNNCHFVFAGDGFHREKFFNTLNGNIKYSYMGILESERLAELLSVSDLSLVPLKMIKKHVGGNIPVKCFESWSAGIPVLLSAEKTSEIGQIFERCKAGVLIEPNNPELFNENLASILTTNNLRAMGDKGRELVEKEYDRAIQAGKLSEIVGKFRNNSSH